MVLVWSNFEIADMDFWRSEAYMKYFEFLDSKGGFYYEVCFFSATLTNISLIIYSDGAMLLYIVLEQHYLPRRNKFISSKKLDTAMNLSSIAHRRIYTGPENAGARRRITLIMKGMYFHIFITSLSNSPSATHVQVDLRACFNNGIASVAGCRSL